MEEIKDMASQIDLQKLDEQIQNLKQAAQALNQMSDEFPAIKRNTARVLSSIKMMEINVSDIIDLAASTR